MCLPMPSIKPTLNSTYYQFSLSFLHEGFPKLGYHFGGPYNEDYRIWGSILGSPYLGKLPHSLQSSKARHADLPLLCLLKASQIRLGLENNKTGVHVTHSLNSLMGGYIGDYIGDYYRGYYGYTRSLDYGPCRDAYRLTEGYVQNWENYKVP